MQKRSILTLPFSSTSLLDDPELSTRGSDLEIRLQFDAEGEPKTFALRFIRQRAFRKRTESLCTAWHVEGVYDTICEIDKSTWLTELLNGVSSLVAGPFVMRHFMVYLDSFGCVEVVAEDVEITQLNQDGSYRTPPSAPSTPT